jgi:hypothetical protein
MRAFSRVVACAASILASCAAIGQTATEGEPDPTAILAAAKAASGGAAWDALTVQHSLVAMMSGGLSGEAERWSEIATGRSYLRFAIGPMSGAMGYDGTASWSQDPAGKTRIGTDEAEVQLAANAAYRDQLAFWYPNRHAASITYQSRSSADGANFDVVAITPDGGREFDLWVNTDTKLIERLVEREAVATRTEIYMDWKDVQGVKIPFRVRVLRGDPKADELVVVQRIEYNGAIAGISFARPE